MLFTLKNAKGRVGVEEAGNIWKELLDCGSKFLSLLVSLMVAPSCGVTIWKPRKIRKNHLFQVVLVILSNEWTQQLFSFHLKLLCFGIVHQTTLREVTNKSELHNSFPSKTSLWWRGEISPQKYLNIDLHPFMHYSKQSGDLQQIAYLEVCW